MHELFVPQGSNPLANLKLGNPRCTKVEFDRTVRSNVMVIEGDLTQSRVQIPKEDRPVSSLQLNHSLVVLQILIPSSGQFLLELNVSNSPVTRMRLSAATFISRADVVDAKGMAHAKIPLVIPRNCWVQIVFHVGGIFSHLFRLPAVKWIDSVVLAGSCKVRKIVTCADEATAIESKPGGMLLFAVPAYGPPVWQTAGGGGGTGAAARQTSPTDPPPPQSTTGPKEETPPSNPSTPSGISGPSSASGAQQGASGANGTPTSAEISTRTANRLGPSNGGNLTAEAHSARFPTPSTQLSAPVPQSGASSSSSVPVVAETSGESVSSPLRMRFLRSDDGTISFTAKSAEQEAKEVLERQRQLDIIERLQREAEQVRIREEYERQQHKRHEALNSSSNYVRIVDSEVTIGAAPGQNGGVTGRRGVGTSGASGAVAGGLGGNAAVSSKGPSTDSRGDGAISGRKNSVNAAAVNRAAAVPNACGSTTATSSGSNNVSNDALLDAGDFGSWNDSDENSAYCSLIAGGVGSSVIQTFNAGGKPIVVAKESAALAAAGAVPSRTTAGGNPRKPLVPRRVTATQGPLGRVRKPAQPPSSLMLSYRSLPSECHPADDYDPDLYRKTEPEVGYGVGFMDVLHGTVDDEDEEFEEEEEEE